MCIVWYLKNSSRLIAALVLRAILDESKNQYITHELLSLDLCLLVCINNSVSPLTHTHTRTQPNVTTLVIHLSHTHTQINVTLLVIHLFHTHTHSTEYYYTGHSIILLFLLSHTFVMHPQNI